MFAVQNVVFFDKEEVSSLNNHLTEDRLLELLEEGGPQFSKEELQHLTDCQECGEVLAGFRQSMSDKAGN
jgi:hypothetical protein